VFTEPKTSIYKNFEEGIPMSTIELSPELEARLLSACKLMGYETLYSEQAESIRLNMAKKQTLTLLSTGGGKTACYVIPTLALGRVTVVVSPLIALQNDQVNALKARGIQAFMYNGEVSDEEKEAISGRLMYCKEVKQPAFLFISPESLISERFLELFKPGLFDFMAIDEVHCVSTWGNAFRPDYQRLGKAAIRLQIPLCGGYTATITDEIMKDIFRYTPLAKKICRVVSGESIRPNLHLTVVQASEFTGNMKERADAKKNRLLKFTKQARGAVIVYCGSRYGCNTLYGHLPLRGYLKRQGYTTYLYHAEIPDEEKRKAERGFENDEKPLVFATNAFGMGIDRSDVGLVFHFDNPRNLLSFAQEIGRAGRDGEDADCVTIFDEEKLEVSETFRKFSLPTVAFVESTHQRLKKAYLKKKQGKSRDEFSTSKFMRMLEHTVGNSESLKDPERFINRTRESLALLKRAGYIREDGHEAFQMLRMNPGDKRHGKLIDFTQMSERSEVAQSAVVGAFFTAENPTQELLWELLG